MHNINFYRDAIVGNIGEVILQYLQNKSVKDIMLNENGIIFINHVIDGFKEVGYMDALSAEGFILSVAAYMRAQLNYYYPRLRGELPKHSPFNGERIEAMVYPLVTNPCFAIRKPALRVFSLDDYLNNNQISLQQLQAIKRAVQEKKNILISGGTGTGKTTLLNAIIAEISTCEPNSRLYIIQDVLEIQTNHKNALCPRTTEDINMNHLLESGMRYSPTRIIVGELLGKEAFTFLAATNTGHQGCMATIHANSATDALYRLCTILQTHNYQVAKVDIARQINVVIHIGLREGNSLPVVQTVALVESYHSAEDVFIVSDRLYEFRN